MTTDKLATLEAAASGTAVATTERAPSLAQTVRQVIDRQGDAFRQVMPAGYDGERFGRLVLTAVKATPELTECFHTKDGQTSVLLAAMKAASVGLEPNTELQHAWLLPRRNKNKDTGEWVTECELQIGYRGYLELARRSGHIKDIYAEVVREGDEFTVEYGLHRDITHRIGPGPRGELTHAYAVAHFTSGGYAFRVLDRLEVEARKAKSPNKSDYGPWATAEEAMWRKSAVRALVPFLPLSAEVQRDIAADEARLSLSDDGSTIEVAHDDVAELEAGDDA